MRNHPKARFFKVFSVLASVLTLAGGAARGAAGDIDLDGTTTNGNESSASLTIVTTSPVKVKNKVTNKAVGQAFNFTWPAAGPGGFTSNVAAGTAGGVGTTWTWETTQQIFSIPGTITFTRTVPGPATRTFSNMPGRSLTSSGVTTSAASLSSSLQTFFSPPKELVRVASGVLPIGANLYKFRRSVQNLTPDPIHFEWAEGPLGCYDDSGLLTGGFPCEFFGLEDDVDGCPPEVLAATPGNCPLVEDCFLENRPGKEVTSAITVCGDSLPGGPETCDSNPNTGIKRPAGVFVPEYDSLPADVFVSTTKLEVRGEPSGDGRLEPGESASLFVTLLNSGSLDFTIDHATISDPGYDHDGDGTPDSFVITPVDAAFPVLPGLPEVGGKIDCEDAIVLSGSPRSNTTPFQFSLPASFPGDAGHKLILHLEGHTAACAACLAGQTGAAQMLNVHTFDIPFVVGVHGACTASEKQNFDGLVGLLPPMGPLVPAGNEVPLLTTATFAASKSRPLKLKLYCGSTPLGLQDVKDAPEVVGLARLQGGVFVPLPDFGKVDLDDNANSDSLLFRDTGNGGWIYNLRSKLIGPGTYELTIQMPDGQPYKTRFVVT